MPNLWVTLIGPGNAKLWFHNNSVLRGLTQRFTSGSSLTRIRWFVMFLPSINPRLFCFQLYHLEYTAFRVNPAQGEHGEVTPTFYCLRPEVISVPLTYQ